MGEVPRRILSQDQLYQIALRTGLAQSTVSDMLHRGWKFIEIEGEPSRWVSPMASLQQHIPHQEPKCGGCVWLHPHTHGLGCHRSCTECHGVCHPDCPAYKET